MGRSLTAEALLHGLSTCVGNIQWQTLARKVQTVSSARGSLVLTKAWFGYCQDLLMLVMLSVPASSQKGDVLKHNQLVVCQHSFPGHLQTKRSMWRERARERQYLYLRMFMQHSCNSDHSCLWCQAKCSSFLLELSGKCLGWVDGCGDMNSQDLLLSQASTNWCVSQTIFRLKSTSLMSELIWINLCFCCLFSFCFGLPSFYECIPENSS